ncbi:hypothetical protein N7530_000408 [Penicillium desertorum]|uniref:AMP-dependent synthetase/ligase domain-containing protein n=1 Tax=Penicillium desertorum TaxID=1303715 RepID=A0A9W9X7V8_9EURO|nr:hypothetical protein N7530_000408 [Penicillium desertorum]
MTVSYQNTLFPDDEILRLLLKAARFSKRDIIVDFLSGITADYTQLLADVIKTRQRIWTNAKRSTFDDRGLVLPESPYVFLLATSSYLVPVASFAILSIGAAVCPMSPSLKEADALNSMRKAKSSIMLVDPMEMEHAMSIKAYASSQGENIIAIPISFLNPSPPTLSHLRIRIDPRWKLDSNQPGLLIMTSGTTGPSKGVIHARRIFTHALRYLTNEDVFLCHRSAAWMGGIMPLIAGLCRGVQLEIVTRDASVLWERLRTGKVTVLRSAPGIWANLMNYYKETISNLTPHVREQYIRGVQNLHSAVTSGGYLLPHRRVGTPWPDVAVKLSGGGQGEILIKSPTIFLGYLGNSEATKAAFDEDGYFKTGDIGRWQDGEYILMGRTSEVVIRYIGHKVPILDVEAYVSKLPYIAEACVLSVPSPNNRLTEQRVGILVRVKVSNEGRGRVYATSTISHWKD